MSDDEDLCPDWLFEDDHPDSYFMPLNDLTYTQPEVVRRVYSLGRTISSVFRESGLTYWSSGGTTLGIVRHRGLIPWDDDIDICVLEKVFVLMQVTPSPSLCSGRETFRESGGRPGRPWLHSPARPALLLEDIPHHGV